MGFYEGKKILNIFNHFVKEGMQNLDIPNQYLNLPLLASKMNECD